MGGYPENSDEMSSRGKEGRIERWKNIAEAANPAMHHWMAAVKERRSATTAGFRSLVCSHFFSTRVSLAIIRQSKRRLTGLRWDKMQFLG